MGWAWISGAATPAMAGPHVDNPPDDFSDQDFWRWVKEATDWDIASGRDNPLGNSRAMASRPRWQGAGLPGYFDIATGAANQTLRLDVSLRHPGPQGLTVSTRSAAETFFDRPQPRADGQAESANLFHPYWQARLSAQLEPGIATRGQP